MIKTWQQRCEEHPDHDGIVSDGMIQARMQEEIDELRAVIEQVQEPVAWMYVNTDGECEQIEYIENDPMPDDPSVTPLYTTPRQWKGLTDEDVKAPIQRAMQHFGYDPTQYSLGGMATIGFYGLVKEIEAKLKEKNT